MISHYRAMLTTMALFALLIVPAIGMAHAADKGAPAVTLDSLLRDDSHAVKWTGCYVGLHTGASFAHAQATGWLGGALPVQNHVRKDQILGGIHGGCDLRAGNVVFGVMGDYTYSNELNHTLGLSARAGFLLTESVLLYSLGGYTWAFDIADIGIDTNGWHVGAGVDWKFDNHWSLRTEYHATFYDSEAVGVNVLGLGTIPGRGDVRDHQLRLGVSYRF